MEYDFDVQHAMGKKGEQQQDEYYSRWFDIEPATPEQQAREIDRIFTAKSCPLVWKVEYKLDDWAQQSGNLAIEMVSVIAANKPGWAIRCDADVISIVLPERKIYYLLSVPLLSHWAGAWLLRYGTKETNSSRGTRTWQTRFIAVPCKTIEKSPPCIAVFHENAISSKNQNTFPFTT